MLTQTLIGFSRLGIAVVSEYSLLLDVIIDDCKDNITKFIDIVVHSVISLNLIVSVKTFEINLNEALLSSSE